MYAQRGEDEYLKTVLPDFGRYLDIGAYNGKTFSNTRLLAEEGWEGVSVEPSAHCFAAMVLDPPPNGVLVNALVGRHRGLTAFHYSRDALSTTSDAHARKWASLAGYIPTFAVTVTVGDLLETFPGPYDLISVDTEGTTAQIVEDLIPHLNELKCRALVYEHDGDFFKVPGFTETLRTIENAVLVRD